MSWCKLIVCVGTEGFYLIIEAAKLGKDSTRTCTHPSVCYIFIIHAPRLSFRVCYSYNYLEGPHVIQPLLGIHYADFDVLRTSIRGVPKVLSYMEDLTKVPSIG